MPKPKSRPKIELTRARGVSKRDAKAVAAGLLAQFERLAARKPKKKAGYLGHDGKPVVEPTWDQSFEHSDGLAEVRVGFQSFVVDTAGTPLPEPVAGTGAYLRGLMPVGIESNVAWGYIDGKGDVKIRGPFEAAHPFYGPIAAVELAGTHRWITPEGELVGDPFGFSQYLLQCRFREDRVWTTGERCWYLADEQGRRVGKRAFADVTPFSEGVAAVRELDAKTWSYIDRDAKPVLAGKFAVAFPFTGGRALVLDTANKYRIIDRAGAYVGKPFAAGNACATQIGAGLLPFLDGKKVGYLRVEDGEVAIAPKFGIGGAFINGFARVCPLKKSSIQQTFIDPTGAPITDQLFDNAYDFQEQRAAVAVERKWGFLDETGKFVVKPRYATVFSYSCGVAAFSR